MSSSSPPAHHGHHHSHDEAEAEAERQESIHFHNVVRTFQQYRAYSLSANSRRLRDYYALPLAHQELLDSLGWRSKIDAVDRCIETNARFLNTVVDYPEIFEEGSHRHLDEDYQASHTTNEDVENADITAHRSNEPHPYDNLRPEQSQPHDHGSAHNHSHSHDPRRAPDHEHSHPHPHTHGGPSSRKTLDRKQRVSDNDMDKLRSTLKQFVRDWSAEGQAERDMCYTPILEALDAHFGSITGEEREKLQVLVPGTGLARLPFEVIRRGYSCQGNEFSHFMLLSAYFILNRTSEINEFTIHPYIHSFSNMRSSETLLKGFQIPDLLPSSLPRGPAFSLVAGDFEEIYGVLDEDDEKEPQQGKWDAVLTCFFIDTAKNVVNYLKIIHDLLAPGGVWINLGPLLWHFENSSNPSDTSIELSLEEVQALAEKIGFEVSNQKMVDATYVDTLGEGSMLSHVYHAAFWTATKKQA